MCVLRGKKLYFKLCILPHSRFSSASAFSSLGKAFENLIIVQSQSVSPHHHTERLFLRNSVRKGLLFIHLNINMLTGYICCKIVMDPWFTALTKQSWSAQKRDQSDLTNTSSKAHVVVPLRQSANNTRRKVRPAQGDLKSTLKNIERKFPSVFNHVIKTSI